MSFIARSRANSEVSSSSSSLRLGAWVDDLFPRYTFPAHTWSDGAKDNNNTCAHRVEIQYLGASYLQSGPYCVSSAAFYEITETTDKDIYNEDNNMVMEQQQYVLSSSVSSPSISTIGGDNSLSSAAAAGSENSSSGSNTNPVNMLPPKKRRRHKVIRNDVIFCINPPPASELHTPSPHLDYYLFPHDAVAGAINDVPPFELVFTFHVPTSSLLSASPPSSSMDGPHFEERRPTKLEEFAAVCSSANRMYARRRSTDPGTSNSSNSRMMTTSTTTASTITASTLVSTAAIGSLAPPPPMPVDDPRCKVVNMRISGVSRRLFVAIKQTVSEYETVCGRMVQLMKYHTQQMAGQKGSPISKAPRPLLTPVPPSPIIPSAHAEWEELLKSRDQQPHHNRKFDACSSDDTNFDKDDMLVDPIPKSSYSNGSSNNNNTNTSRWPTSPRTAPTTLSSNGTSSHHSNTNDNSNMNTTTTTATATATTTATGTTTTSTSKNRGNSSGGAVKKCLYCGSKSTPMWRRGPQGAGTLCNACGVKWKHGKILSGSTSTDMLGSSSNMDRPPTAPKERRGSNKNDKKRKKSTSSGGNGGGRADRRGGQRSASATPVMETTTTTTISSSTPSPFKSLVQQQKRNSNSEDDDMENNINAARNLSIREDENEYHPRRQLPSTSINTTFAVPWLPRDSNSTSNPFASEYYYQQQQQQQQHHHHHHYRPAMATTATAIDAHSLSSSSHSISGSYSPIESSPNSSPRLSSAASSVVSMHHSRRHTVDVAMADQLGNSEASYPMSVGVDAVEAAALLTLLKRS